MFYQNNMKRIGIYYSSFDPCTKANIKEALRIRKEYNLDYIFFLVENNKYKIDILNISLYPYRKLKVLVLENNILNRFKNKQVLYFGSKVDELNIDNKLDINCIQDDCDEFKKGDINRVDKNVMKYITKNNLYIESIAQSFYTEKRWVHALSVAQLARIIAISNNKDPNKTYRAGLLHDLGKKLSIQETEYYMSFNTNLFEQQQPTPVLHQYTSCKMAKRLFKENDSEVLSAIKHHTLGDDLKPISKIIYCADKIDPSRGYDSSEMINECIKDIDIGYEYVYNHNQEYLQENGVIE